MLIWTSWPIRCRRWQKRSLKLRSDGGYGHTSNSIEKMINMVVYSCHNPTILASGAAALVGFGCGADVLRQVLYSSLWTIAFGTSRVDGNELTFGDTTANIEDVFNLVELTAGAGKDGSSSELLLERAGDLGVGVGLARAGSDTGIGQPLIGRQVLEQRDGGVEEIDKLVFLFVVAVAVGVQGGVTSSVLTPFVLPDQWLADDWKLIA